jgi:cysteine desulfuration protein SufE
MTETRLDQFKSNPLGTTLTIDEVLENFTLLDDWEERYSYIADLGKGIPVLPEGDRCEANRVHGCQSQVWLSMTQDPETRHLYLLIDSDAIIVKGLAAIVMIALNNRLPEEIVKLDVIAIFERMDLLRHISPTRGNGLRSMLDRVKAIAGTYC